MSIVSVFQGLEKKVYAELVSIFGQSAVDDVDAKIKIILQADVRIIFQDAITAASAMLNASGQQKHDVAFAQITTDLKAQGKALEPQLVNFGIELVLGLVRGKAA